MATESPMRFIGSSIVSNWPGGKDTASFSASRRNVAELELLLEDDAFRGNREFTAPSRSGSAPPTMEGSSMTIGDLSELQNSRFNSIYGKYVSLESCHSEGQHHVDPAYVPYNNNYLNLNPRIPRPPPSQDNRRSVHNWRMPSFDDNNKRSVPTSRPALPTHKEESEDDRSPKAEFDNCRVQSTSGSMFRQSTSFHDHCKSNVHLTQGGFLRTPSPVYNGQSYPLSHVVLEHKTDADACVSSSDDSTKNMIKSESKALSASVNACVGSSNVSIPKAHSLATKPLELPAVSIVSSSSSVLTDTCSPDPSVVESKDENFLYNSGLPVSVTGSNTISIGNDIKNLKISTDSYRSQPARQSHHQNNLQSRVPSFPVHLGESQITNQGMPLFNLVDLFSHGQSKLSSMEVPALQSAGIVPTLYATAAAYGAPYYPGMQPSNLFPQFGIGGFSENTSLLPPFLSGYPSYNAISMSFQTPTGPNYSARTSGVSPGGNITPGYYGHLGIVSQPSYTEPMYVSYFQHPSAHAYASAGQFDPMASSGSAIGSSPGSNTQKGPLPIAYSSDQRPHFLRAGPVNTPSIRKGGTASTNFYGSTPNLGLFMQYPTSPLTSPVYPASPVANTGSFGKRSESNRSPGSSGRAGGTYSGWQGPRLRDKVDDSKSLSFLEELKSSRSRRYDLSDITGRIVEFSADQHGSRFIQQKLESCSVEEKASVFEEVLPHASTLMTDVFGNYVIQKFFEHGSLEQRKELGNQLIGRILPLSLQMYGCRVIQKALEVIELDHKTQLVHELDGHVMRCVRDQNGNHVIQKCIECVPTEKIGFIISAFRGHVATLSMHPYGCRVIQRVLEHCTDELQNQCIVDEILQSVCVLAQDQYGNYVTQHILERGNPLERSQIINKLSGQVVQMSQHKFASNVIEKCLEHGNSAERELLIVEILGQTEGNDNLLVMMKDQFANYVVQKILEVGTDTQRDLLLDRIQSHLQALKKYTYGKHIVARVEQLFVDGEESPTSGS